MMLRVHSQSQSRRGSILVVTMTVVVIVGFLLVSSADNVMSIHAQTYVGLAQQKAGYAAESVAADEEDTLVAQAAANNLAGLETMQNCGVEWMNDCVVRWRIEPVRTKGTDAALGGPVWSVNPPSNVSAYSTMSGFNNGDGTYATNYDYYVFRIVTEAWALNDPNYMLPPPPYTPLQEPSMPWNIANIGDPRRGAMTSVQSSRVIQLRLNSLFKYCIFYAANGATGDIEFHPGAEMTIPGAVHSNGAIYFGGGGSQLTRPPPNAGPVYVGGILSGLGGPTTVVGINGIFRMRKSTNLINGYVNPMTVPLNNAALSLNGGMNSPYEMNDHQLNVANDGSYCNDSRNGAQLQATFGAYVRDGVTLGATPVQTLSNIPQLAGRPFEIIQEAPANSYISLINPLGLLNDPTNWTIHAGLGTPHPGGIALQYKNPTAGDYSLTTATWFTKLPTYPLPTASPPTIIPGGATILSQNIPAQGMPLYGPPPGDITLLPPVAGVGGFDSNEFQGPYYADALIGKGDGTYGIVVRERNAQQVLPAPWTSPGATYGYCWPDLNVPDPTLTPAVDYATILNTFGLPNDGTAPSRDWIIYSGCANNPYLPWEASDPTATGQIVMAATASAGRVPSIVNSWVTNGAVVNAQTVVGRDHFSVPNTAIGSIREKMPRLDYYVHVNVAGTYKPYLYGYCNDLISPAGDSSHNLAYVGMTAINATTYATPNFLGAGAPVTVPLHNGATLTWSTAPIPATGWALVPGEYVMHVWMGDDASVLSQVDLTSTIIPSGGAALGLNAVTTVGIPTTQPAAPTYPQLPMNPYLAEVLYLKSQYAAVMGGPGSPAVPIDITNSTTGSTALPYDYTSGFFGASPANFPITSYSQLPAFESNLMDRRAADWLRQCVIAVDAAATPAFYKTASFMTCTNNTITLNLDQVQAFIKASFVPTPTTSTFNGLLYCARTRRGAYPVGYNPVFSPLLNWTNLSTNFGGWPSGATLGANPIPWFEQVDGSNTRLNNRVPTDGPDYTFNESVRLAQGNLIDWGGRTGGGLSRIKGLTVVTPNNLYLQGDINIIPDMAASTTAPANIGSIFTAPIPSPITPGYMHGQLQRSNSGYGGPYSALTEAQLSTNVIYPPVAVFADQISVLSNSWQDAPTTYMNDLPSSQTWYNTSVILNNVPTDATNVDAEGSGGVHNVIRFLENWGGVWYHFRGSLVCMNAAKYTHGGILSSPSEVSSPMPAAYSPPSRDLRFNTDLLTQAGQPPFAPFGVQVIRTVSTINDGQQ